MLTTDIETNRLVLSCLQVEQVDETYLGWMTDAETVQYLETRGAAPSLDSLRTYVQRMRDSDDSYFFGIFLREGGRHVGNIKLGPISAKHASAHLGLVIGDKAVWGTGIAGEAVGALTEWGFAHLALEKIIAGSYARNVGSVRAFQRQGFSIEGVQRRHVALDSGERDDVILLGRTRADDGRSTL